MPGLVYYLNKIERCGCYILTIDDGFTQTVTTYDDNCNPDQSCTCYLNVILNIQPPTAATYMELDMYTPDGAVTADGTVDIVIDFNTSTCDFINDIQLFSINDIFALHRSNMPNGMSYVWPLIYSFGTTNNPPFSTDEATAISLVATGPNTLTLSGLIAVPYDGYTPIMQYYLYLADKGNCTSVIPIEYLVPYELEYVGFGNASCAVDVQTVEFTLTHNSLTPIPAGHQIEYTISSSLGALTGINATITGLNVTIDSPTSDNTFFELDEDWDPGVSILVSIDYDEVGCNDPHDTTLDVTPLSNPQSWVNYPYSQTINII